MKISSRVEAISESITLKLNAKAVELADQGNLIYNLTAGQLPFRPLNEFIDLIRAELSFIKSYQYSPVAGFLELRQKILNHIQKTRNIDFAKLDEEFDCLISNGAKHSLSNVLGSLIEPGDEVIILAPYWVSYPAMIKFCRGEVKVVGSSIFDVFTPSLEEIKNTISDKTKAIIINSPNNPSGTHYSSSWMKNFGELMLNYPDINIICDEIYYELFYFDPKPTYFYQYYPELLSRTIIVDGISKTLASTGLRVGYCIAPKKLIKAITKLQGQTTSGANSLVQRALINFDFELTEKYLAPIKSHLRENAQLLREKYRKANLDHCWYQSTSAFYYLVDFSKTPIIERFKKSENDKGDYASQVCEYLLESKGLVLVPGSDFGMPNTARMSLVLEKGPFEEAVTKLIDTISSK